MQKFDKPYTVDIIEIDFFFRAFGVSSVWNCELALGIVKTILMVLLICNIKMFWDLNLLPLLLITGGERKKKEKKKKH